MVWLPHRTCNKKLFDRHKVNRENANSVPWSNHTPNTPPPRHPPSHAHTKPHPPTLGHASSSQYSTAHCCTTPQPRGREGKGQTTHYIPGTTRTPPHSPAW